MYTKPTLASAITTNTQHKQKKHHLHYSSEMAASATTTTHLPLSISHIFVPFLFVFLCSFPIPVLSDSSHQLPASNQTFNPSKELLKLKRVNAYLKKINKPPLKTIQSPDGDVIDCVLSHLQPAFDHPQLKGQKPLVPPDRRPKGNETSDGTGESSQLWADSGESCPEGTVPIRRTTEKDILRANKLRRFGRKRPIRHLRRDSAGNGHEHAVVFVNGQQYYGAKANINVSPELYGDNYPRFFTYWTTDAYQATGCYNLLCSGFVQTNNRIAIGAAISPRSSYHGRQFDIGLMVWKDPKHGHWWLEFGSGLLVGYWPAFLFSHLRSHASMVQFGGEVVNSRSTGVHTYTQMGSGHFADEGFGKASYFRNLQTVDWDNNLLPLTNLHLLADHPNCYNIRQGRNNVWGTYFYYGGPGRNVRCP
ncbi:hypothetical protein LINPERPRIM_LOCUS41270 [Linum perenne]